MVKPPQKYKIQKSPLWHKGRTASAGGCLLNLISDTLPCSLGYGHSSLLFFDSVNQSLYMYCPLCLGVLFLQLPAQFYTLSFSSVSEGETFHDYLSKRVTHSGPSTLCSHDLLYFSLQHLSPFDIILYIFICLFIFGLFPIKKKDFILSTIPTR